MCEVAALPALTSCGATADCCFGRVLILCTLCYLYDTYPRYIGGCELCVASVGQVRGFCKGLHANCEGQLDVHQGHRTRRYPGYKCHRALLESAVHDIIPRKEYLRYSTERLPAHQVRKDEETRVNAARTADEDFLRPAGISVCVNIVLHEGTTVFI